MVARVKSRFVESNPELSRFFKSVTELRDVYAYDSSQYCLVGCDMVKVQELHGKLQAAGINWGLPTIVLTGMQLTILHTDEVLILSGQVSTHV